MTARQRRLLASVVRRASHITEQTLILTVEASRLGASEADLRAVRDHLLAGYVLERECDG
jgi:hypothetical protein